jgi:hypothetical protein
LKLFKDAKAYRTISNLAQEEISASTASSVISQADSLRNPDGRILWLKAKGNAMPLYFRPFALFFYRYFLQLGFLDVKEGFIEIHRSGARPGTQSPTPG